MEQEQGIINTTLIYARYFHLLAFLLCSVAAVVAFKKQLIILGAGLLLLAFPTAYSIVCSFSLKNGVYWAEKHWAIFLAVRDFLEIAAYALILIHVLKSKMNKGSKK